MRITGWLWYVYVESFGSLIVALFWSFTTDITDENAAKRGFPLIAMLGQLGNIVGYCSYEQSVLVLPIVDRWWQLVVLCSPCYNWYFDLGLYACGSSISAKRL